jgi:hypothetical protein
VAIIAAEKALNLVAHLSDEQLRASVSDAFLRRKFLPTGMRGEDQPEDLYIALLSTERSTPVIEGCIDVFSALAPALFAPNPALTERESDALYHLMALIGVAQPPALQGHTQGILQLILKHEIPKTIRNPVVRAALGYARTENDAKFWEPLVGQDLIPGYAFKALLQIDPRSPRIANHLVDLWQRKLHGGLALEVAALTADASKSRGDDENFVRNVIARVSRTTTLELRERLIVELGRYPWSKAWVKYAAAPAEYVRQETIKTFPTIVVSLFNLLSRSSELSDKTFTKLPRSLDQALRDVSSYKGAGKAPQVIKTLRREGSAKHQERRRRFICLYQASEKPVMAAKKFYAQAAEHAGRF